MAVRCTENLNYGVFGAMGHEQFLLASPDGFNSLLLFKVAF